jgi:hypothetical protein
VITPASSGITVNYRNDGGVPQITSNVDLNNPANFDWPGGRVNLQDEKRETETKGLHANFTFGEGDKLSYGFGAAYDDVMRQINAFDNSQAWQNAACGNQPSIFLPGPNNQPPCAGAVLPATVTAGNGAPTGYPNYPALGTFYTAGQSNTFSYLGSLIPAGAPLRSYLTPGPDGFITVDWDKFTGASQYDAFHAAAPEVGGAAGPGRSRLARVASSRAPAILPRARFRSTFFGSPRLTSHDPRRRYASRPLRNRRTARCRRHG